jgi:glycosyltransferase involved in cell wall biosynthesis
MDISSTRPTPGLVSVVIPTHNRRVALQAGLRSVLGQRNVDLEVIVVDDGSRDDTPQWLGQVGDPRLRVLRHEVATGVATARNHGIAAARGEWLAFLDDDDLWAPDKLCRQLATAEEASADLVYVGAFQTDSSRRVTALLACPEASSLGSRIYEHNVLPAGQSSVIVRREVLDRVGGFDPRLAHFADWDMWIRLVEQARCAACPEPLVAYVVHDGGMLVSGVGDQLGEVKLIRAKHGRSARVRGARVGGDEFLGWMIWVHRRAGRRFAAARLFVERGIRARRPGDIIRAGGMLVGERAMARFRREPPAIPQPDWIDQLWSIRAHQPDGRR